MDDLDYIVETVFGHESEADKHYYRERLLSDENPGWTKEFAKKTATAQQRKGMGQRLTPYY